MQRSFVCILWHKEHNGQVREERNIYGTAVVAEHRRPVPQ